MNQLVTKLETSSISTTTLKNGRTLELRTSRQINGINPFLYFQIGIGKSELRTFKKMKNVEGIVTYENVTLEVSFFHLLGFGETRAAAEKMAERKY